MPKGIAAISPKLARAKQHIDNLHSALRQFHRGGPSPCNGIAKDYLASGKTLYEITDVAEIPISVPLLIGDALQNLRSSLDYLACELTLAADPTNNISQTAFPIFETAEDYASSSPRKVAGMREDVIRKIATFKPYKGGNDTLWKLHTLNNRDKHRLLITCVASFAMRTGSGQEDGIPTFTAEFTRSWIPLQKGTKFALPIAEDENNSNIHCEVTFDEPGVTQGESVTTVLDQTADVVTDLISSFTPFLI